ncbi:NAD(P)-dependent dehydrogenase (short-subunit alcohol dehydrogenase family) [Rhodoblastus acidophilus]|uniref:SDR family NAD(P)-dependent oxidoreductase n=1 Tax=Rhodoblastus acidophilus TaxID=1074 RepID=UPI002224FF6C|nr:SDR family oxidoreductase [Rhodoblastus acidophilus]MCW2284118.1 NAD(P)-dependent dehydrogenase (short-subunit alcohol dehydrogenase family) [Rhodoblastus acidophilus]MCW2332814.1 NAD(P)-dependent dehydrogenase (short-subunit alcohol dehydrogenase family) [Rhodoblastus acidophilus]
MSLFDLAGRRVVVTGAGANGGIGHALALGFAKAGARLALCDIDADGLSRTVEETQAAFAAGCDISVEAEVEAFFARACENLGGIDVLVNVPFVFPRRCPPHELPLADWERMFAVNVTGYFLCIRAALPLMLGQGGGAIINIGSNAGETALGRGAFAYSATKSAVHQMTRELAVEYCARGVRVNALAPAQVLTPGLAAHMDNPHFRDNVLPRILMGLPMGRLLTPEDMVGPALFLASDAAACVNGVILPVDGGNLAMNAGGGAPR